MEHNKVIALFVITLIFFIGVFLRPSYRSYNGMDAYYFKNYIADKSDNISQTPALGKLIFSVLPNNDFVIKLVMFLVTFGIVYMFGRVGEYYSPKYGWLAGAILLTGLFFHNIFIRLEDDLFGLFFVTLSWCFLVDYHRVFDRENTGKIMPIILSLICLAIAVFIWKWAIFFVFIFWLASKNHPLYLISGFGALFLFWKDLINGIIPNMAVSESLPVIGFLSLGIMMISYTKHFKIHWYKYSLILATLLTLINLKFIFVLFPIITLNFVKGWTTLPMKYQKALMIALGITFLYLCIHNYTSMPGEDMHELVEEYKLYQGNDYTTQNNWSYGYYLIDQGIATNSFGCPGQDNVDYKNVVLTYNNDQNIINCITIFSNTAGIIADCNRSKI